MRTLTSGQSLLLLGSLLFAGACSTSPTEPESLALNIGVHRVQLIVPPGWQHIDHGREHRFEHGQSRVSLADMGPATRDAFLREIDHARDLFRRGQQEDARALLSELRPRPLFPSEQRWSTFQAAWREIRRKNRAGRPLDAETVERSYAEVLAEIDSLPQPDMGTLAEAALESLGHDERYDIALEEARAIDGHEALLVDTWDRLSHDHRRRHLFVLDEGNLLVARMEMGRFEEMAAAFDALVASIRIGAGTTLVAQ